MCVWSKQSVRRAGKSIANQSISISHKRNLRCGGHCAAAANRNGPAWPEEAKGDITNTKCLNSLQISSHLFLLSSTEIAVRTARTFYTLKYDQCAISPKRMPKLQHSRMPRIPFGNRAVWNYCECRWCGCVGVCNVCTMCVLSSIAMRSKQLCQVAYLDDPSVVLQRKNLFIAPLQHIILNGFSEGRSISFDLIRLILAISFCVLAHRLARYILS